MDDDIKKNIANLKPSATLAINEKVKKLIKDGKKVFNFGFGKSHFHIPEKIGLLGGLVFDLLSKMSNRTFNISYIRIKKFISPSIVSTKKIQADFPQFKFTDLNEAIDLTIKHDFKKNSLN